MRRLPRLDVHRTTWRMRLLTPQPLLPGNGSIVAPSAATAPPASAARAVTTAVALGPWRPLTSSPPVAALAAPPPLPGNERQLLKPLDYQQQQQCGRSKRRTRNWSCFGEGCNNQLPAKHQRYRHQRQWLRQSHRRSQQTVVVRASTDADGSGATDLPAAKPAPRKTSPPLTVEQRKALQRQQRLQQVEPLKLRLTTTTPAELKVVWALLLEHEALWQKLPGVTRW